MYNLRITNSCHIWKPSKMKLIIHAISYNTHNFNPEGLLNRSYKSMYIEWWLHNIGYYITLPFCFNEKIKKLNERFKHLDLEEWE